MHLTRQEKTVIAVVLGLLLLRWAVKVNRAAHDGSPGRPVAVQS